MCILLAPFGVDWWYINGYGETVVEDIMQPSHLGSLVGLKNANNTNL